MRETILFMAPPREGTSGPDSSEDDSPEEPEGRACIMRRLCDSERNFSRTCLPWDALRSASRCPNVKDHASGLTGRLNLWRNLCEVKVRARSN